MASSSQAQRIHSGVTNSQGGAVFNDDLHSARDININHITTVRPLARSLYRSCLTSSDLFKDIQNELAAFLSALEITQETCIELNIDITNHPTLRHLSQSSNKVLRDLQDLQTHFDSVGAQTQVTWERMGWGAEEVADIRERLSSHIATLNLFNCNMINSSQRRIEQRLNMFIEEVRAGKREGSVISTQTIDSLSTDERGAWRQLRKELEGVGITPALFSQHSLFIVTTLQRALIEEGLAGDVTLGDSHMTTESGQETLLLSHPIQSEATVPAVRLINTSIQQFSSQRILTEKTLPDEMTNETNPKAAKKPIRMARILYRLLVPKTKFVDAALRGDAILAKQLLERGATPSSKELGCVLLHARENEHMEIVKMLLKCSNLDIEYKDSRGLTPLLWAALGGHEAVVKLILTRPDIDADSTDLDGRTPLSWAAAGGYEAVVKLLLTHSHIKADSKDFLGHTPLSWAAAGGYQAVVKLFLTRSDVNADSKDAFNRTPLLWAVRCQQFIRSNFITNSKDHSEQTLRSPATTVDHDTLINLLLTHFNINSDSEENFERTFLTWMAKKEDGKLMERLPKNFLFRNLSRREIGEYEVVIRQVLARFDS